MKSVQVQLTTVCNERCFMCRKYTWKKKEIEIEVLKEKIEKYKDCTFTFSGGDPLAYSNLKELNDLLEKYNIVYQVFTNMNYKLNVEQIRFLDNAKVIQVSLDGSSSVVYNSVRRCRENGLHVVLFNVYHYRKKVKVNCTVSNRNYFDVKNIYDYCKRVGLVVRFFPVHTDENAKLKPYMIEFILNSFEGYGDKNCYPEEIRIFTEATKRVEYNGKCFVKKEHRIIDESGKEYPCCRAINDNGEDWEGKYCIENLSGIEDENILYSFCAECDRYRKFNCDWDSFKDREELFL